MNEGSSKDLLEENAAKFKSYELLILSLLLPSNPKAVCQLVSFDMTVMQIVSDLESYVHSLEKCARDSESQSTTVPGIAKKKTPFKITLSITLTPQ